jgi:recombinational DNA repair ATPase RecF
MTDNRFELSIHADCEGSINVGAAVRIDKIKITNYRFFAGEFLLDVGGENVLLFGENGSGKSSIYRAMELLTGKRIKTIWDERNIFCEEGSPEISFRFTNGTGGKRGRSR